jgi:hypothetical protein
MRKILLLFVFLLCASCYKKHLYVQQETVDLTSLASYDIGTPDPRKAHPPTGQRILVSWDFPKSIFDQNLTLLLTVRFRNNQQDLLAHPLERKRGYTTFFFSNEKKQIQKKILTYQVQVLSKEGKILETWKHHFWTELIDVDQEKTSSIPIDVEKEKDSVEIQPVER